MRQTWALGSINDFMHFLTFIHSYIHSGHF